MSRYKYHLLLGLLLVAGCLYADPVLAQGAGAVTSQAARGQLGWSVHDILLKLGTINTFMHILLLIVLDFVQYLIQSDFFTNPAMMDALNKIWQLSRDIMNVGFALMLVGTAIYTIITAKKDFAMGKISTFVIAVILVNFSWFFPRVIIDVSNILTGTIYTVPKILGNFTCNTFGEGPNPVPQKCKVLTDKLLFGDEAEQAKFCGADYRTANCVCQTGIGCYKLKDFDTAVNEGSSTSNVMLNGLVVNFTKILALNKIPDTAAGPQPLGARQGFYVNLQILMSIMTVLVIQLAVLLPLIGLVVGLFLRIIILWVTIAFMPFIFLGYVVNGKIGTNVFGFETDVWKEFINAAFLPAMVAVPITIGFVMLTTVVSIPPPAGFGTQFQKPLIQGMSWWGMLWMVAAIGILWKGAFAALKKSEIIGNFTEKIKGFGENIFGAAIQLPLLTPLPFPGGGNLAKIVHGPKFAADAIRASVATGTPLSQEFERRFNPGKQAKETDKIASDLSANNPMAQRLVRGIEELQKNPKQNTAKVVEEFHGLLNIKKDANTLQLLEQLERVANNPKAPPEIRKMLPDIQEMLRIERGGKPQPPAGQNPPAQNPPQNPNQPPAGGNPPANPKQP